MIQADTHQKPRYRFESEVHVGLLLIIFILLFLTFISNMVIHKARIRLHDKWYANFNSATLAVNRAVAHYSPSPVPDSVRAELSSQYHLTGLLFVSSRPSDDSPIAKRQWIAAVVTSLPYEQVPELADKLLTSEFGEITRGAKDQYFMVSSAPERAGYPMVVVSMDLPDMAFLDDSSRLILIISLVSLVILGGLYLFLSRFIFAPFRRLREQARKAGRAIDGAPHEADAVVADYQRAIDELHKNQEELLRLNAVIRAKADTLQQFNEYVLKSTESGVMTLDMGGALLVINDTAGGMLGLEVAGTIGTGYRQLLSKTHSLRRALDQVYESGVIPPYAEEQWPNGQVGVTMSFVCDHEGCRVGLWILLFDLTEVTTLRTELENKNRLVALGEMAGGLAHQLRNSMGAIAGYGALVKKRLASATQPTDQIESLLEETGQAELLIRRFLSFARPFDFSPTAVEVDSLVADIVESFRVRNDFGAITWITHCDSNVQALVDALLFKQALGNLIENAALAYPGRKGSIDIVSRCERNDVTIAVIDHGCGIPGDKLEHVFTPFYSSRPSGTGLGLPLAARIIDLHQGRLTLVSRAGQGTTATITLPCLKVPVGRDTAPVAVH
jgi:nitrogen-specific signal transduction histidine kinase